MLDNGTYSAIIIDHQEKERDLLALKLTEFKEIKLLSKESNYENAINSLLFYRPDLVFLNLDLPGKTGFKIANYIKKNQLVIIIIFISESFDHLTDALKFAAFDYLLKPINRAGLYSIIERIRTNGEIIRLSAQLNSLVHLLADKKLRFNTRTGFLQIDPRQIIYCKADGNYSSIYLASGKTVSVTQQLGQLFDQLDPKVFIRVNRSVIININYIFSCNRITRKITLSASHFDIEFPVSCDKIKMLNNI